MSERTYGRRVFVDSRDAKFAIPRMETARTRRFWGDKHFWGDQLATPHCVGFAWTHWLSNAPMVNWLEPDGLYKLAQLIDEWPGENYEGTSVRAGAKVLHMLGLVEQYKWCWDVDGLANAVLEQGPVVVGTDWLAGMEEPNSRGLISATGRNLGGHAYLINGVDWSKELFRIKNSWGQKWGKGGHAYIRFPDMEKLIKAEGEVCLAVERLARPLKRSRPSIQKEE